MHLTELQRAAATGSRWCAVCLGFSIPVSTVLDNALLLLFVMLWFLEGNVAERLTRLRNHPVAMAALAFAASILLGMLWSSAPAEHLRDAAVDSLRLVLLGLFLQVFADASARDRAQFAFLLASMLVLALSFLLWSGIADGIDGPKGQSDYPVVFKDPDTQNLLLALAALLFASHAMGARNRRARALLWLLAVAAAVNVCLVVPGHAGQIALAAGSVFLAFTRYGWRGAALVGAAVVIALGVQVSADSTPGGGQASASQEPATAAPEEVTGRTLSIADRAQIDDHALELIAERPVIGVGTGGFRGAYESKARGTQLPIVDNPHNAFLQVGVELGLIGLAVLIALLTVQWRSAGTIADFHERMAARGFVVMFVAASLLSSTLDNHPESLFYAWASGLLFATARWPASK